MTINTINQPGSRLMTGLTATGSSQATAFPLAGGTSYHEFTTVAPGTGAVLPVPGLPSSVSIHNAGVSTLSIYPPVGGTIDGGSVNAAVTVAAGVSASFWAGDLLTWYSATGYSATGHQPGLTPTAVKTTNYVAAAGDFVPVDATGGDVTVTLPTAPVNATLIAVKCLNATGGNVLVTCGGSDVFGAPNGGTKISLPLTGQSLLVLYQTTAASWYIVAEDLPLLQLDARYSNASILSRGTMAAAQLPTTGLTITQHAGAIGVGSIVSGTATLDLSTHNWYTLTLDHTQRVVIALSNPTVGQQFVVRLLQDSTGSCLVTWFTTIKWPGGSAPTLTKTANKADTFTFKCMSAGKYDGYIVGQNI